MIQLDDYSRFRHTEMIVFDGKETFGRWVMPDLLVNPPTNNNIQTFKVTPALVGRPDLISNAVYNTPLLDWLIIAFNSDTSRGVLNWPKAGQILRYPTEDIVIPQVI